MAYDPIANITALNKKQQKASSQPQQGGFDLMKFLKEATYFPRGVGGALFETGRTLTAPFTNFDAAPNSQVFGGKKKSSLQEMLVNLSTMQNPFLDNQELQNISGRDNQGNFNPLQSGKEASKLFASGASYAVPFGKALKGVQLANPLLRAGVNTLTKAVLPGAAANSLQAYSSDNNVAEAAISGGLTAGALKGGGNLLQGILRSSGGLGNALQSSVIRPFVRPSATAAKTEGELTKESSKIFGKFSSAQGMREQSAKLFQGIQNKINAALPKIKNQLDFYDDVLPKLYEKFDDTIDQTPQFNTKVDQLVQAVSKTTENGKLNASMVNNLKNRYSSILGKAFDKIEKGTPLSAGEDATLALWEGLDEVMRTAFPSIKALTTQQSVLHRLAPGLQKSAQQGIPGNIFGLPLKVATRPVQGLQNAVGAGLSSVAGLGDKQPNAVLNNILMQGASRLGGGGQESPDLNLEQMQDQAAAAGLETEQQGLQLGLGQNDFSFGQPASPRLTEEDVLSLIATNPAGADLFKYLFEQGRKAKPVFTAAEKKDLQKFSMAENVLDQLEGSLPGLEGRGRIGGNIQQIFSATGLSPNVKIYNDFKNGVVIPLVRSLGESGALSNIDVERAVTLVPSVTDTPKEASGKLQKLRSLISQNKDAVLQLSSAGGGNDVSSLMQFLGQ